MITAAAAVLAVLVPGVAQAAAPPPNDDFGNSIAVSALPFTAGLDTSGATRANDDPAFCQFFDIGGTVWFTFTATENGMLRATTAGSDYPTILSANVGERGSLREVDGSCAVGNPTAGATATFRAVAGTTYYFMVAGSDVAGGALSFGLSAVPAAANDDFAGAEPLTLPSTRSPDLSTAWFEPGEDRLSCFEDVGRSVWYKFTPAQAASVEAHLESDSGAAYAVFTGSSLADLREVGCERGGFGSDVLFRADAGVTYYLSVVRDSNFVQPVTLSLAELPPLQPVIALPSEATIFENTELEVFGQDQLHESIVGGQWNFGDGTTAPVTGETTEHHYTADGTYQISVSVLTQVGRSGTTTASLTVTTHDVSITKFDIPARARTGDTKPITVHVANTRYPESATVTLYRSNGQFFEGVGSLTLDVPARRKGTVAFPFAYTFTSQDAIAGKVTFRAVVSLQFPVRDARPQDNEVIALATTVLPSLKDLQFA